MVLFSFCSWLGGLSSASDRSFAVPLIYSWGIPLSRIDWLSFLAFWFSAPLSGLSALSFHHSVHLYFLYYALAVYFKNTKNLFIHIALIPEGDNPRVNPNILKCLLHSPVAKGYRLVVIASRAMVCKTPTYYLILNSLASARGCVILRSHILFPLLLILLISHHI